jgi:hypothetical protein
MSSVGIYSLVIARFKSLAAIVHIFALGLTPGSVIGGTEENLKARLTMLSSSLIPLPFSA